MTLLVTVDRYRVITGDTASAASAVSARIEDAQARLVDELGRQIVLDSYTETLPMAPSGVVYPSVLPVVSVDGGHDVYLGAVGPVSPDGTPFTPRRPATATITYTGGWDHTTVPASVAVDLAWAANALLSPAGETSSIPVGATDVQIGDARVSFNDGGYQGSAGPNIVWSAATLRHRRRRL